MDSSDSKHTKLTAQERDLIAVWKGGGVGQRGIARRLGRSHSTIGDELRRNSFKGHYVAIHAQGLADKRKFLARARHPLKSPQIYSYVIEKLRCGWSPEVIAGRLRRTNGKTVICHETIYKFIYSSYPESKKLKLWQYLPRGQKKRRKVKGRGVKRVRIKARISIHARPAEVDKRTKAGHWEGDSMEGKNHKQGLHVEVERVTRLILARKVERLGARETLTAQIKIFGQIPKSLRKTTTVDNGLEFSRHLGLKAIVDTYFTDPYSAWQKGSVENAIGLIRRYLPKGTDLTEITQTDINDILWEINNRPRKVLDYNTPAEVFKLHLDQVV